MTRLTRALLPLALAVGGSVGAVAAPVEVGLERCDVPGGGPLAGKRIALVAHAASVTSDGRRAVDVLRGRGVTVVRLFAPEHGLSGRASAGATVNDTRDAATGLPVVSLYGGKTRPEAADLLGLDALVIDLQDAGVRFYTYGATMTGCLEAAARSGLPVVVLDRPNPLGGERVEGPTADVGGMQASVLSRLPGPLIHGLTLGEMAHFVAPPSLSLTVVTMRGWQREMVWADTGRPWVAPSPNLRSPDAALAYPGIALLEATNVSEGRGTESPFLLFGAPWMATRAEALNAIVAPFGFSVEEASFVPGSSEAALHPRYEGQACAGFRVKALDSRVARPYAFGLTLLRTLAREPAFRWTEDGRALDRLLGTERVRRALVAGRTTDEILAGDAADVDRFRAERRRALLY